MSTDTALNKPSPPPPTDAPTGARRAADIVDVDLTQSATFGEGIPHEVFDALRAAGGVEWHDEPPVPPDFQPTEFVKFVDSPGFFSVTAHPLVSEVLRDQARFSSELGGTTMLTVSDDSLPMLRAMMLNLDPPDHSRLRRIIQPSFTPRAIAQGLRESVETNARDIIAELGDADGCDLVPTVSAEMPLRVLADLLGMPRGDRHLIFEWSNALLDSDAADDAAGAELGVNAMIEAVAYGGDLVAERRANPTDDMVSVIANAEIDGERLDDTEIAMFWVLLIVAGNETTRSAISGSTVALLEHDKWGWLGAHREAMGCAVEELVRYVSPVQHFRRTATCDTMLGDQHIRAGDKVVVWYNAANRDPAVFDTPNELNLTRDPNPHLGFGIGEHFCLGVHLARLEIATMLRALLDHAPQLALTAEPVRVPSNFVSGIRSLPVTFRG